MKNQKRMLAVIAASGLALGSLPGVANAQTGSLGLGLDLAVNLGSADVGVDLGVALGSVEPDALPTIPTPGEGTFGSLGDITGSAGDGDPAPAPTPGTSSLGSLIPDGEPTPGGSSGSGDEEPAPGSSSGSDEPGSGSAEAKGSLQNILGSLGLPENRLELQGSLEELAGGNSSGSEETDPPAPDGGTGSEDMEGSLEDLFSPGSSSGSDEPGSGSAEAKGSLQNILGSLGLPENRLELQGSLAELAGGNSSGSEETDPPAPDGGTGSEDMEGSLEDLFSPGSSSGSDEPDSASAEAKGSLQNILGSLGLPQNRLELQGSLEGLGSSDNEIILGGGSDDLVESSQALGTGSGVGAVAALGSLALPAVAIGIAVSGNAGLPPLPEVNVGAVCNLPPEAIDFLKGNGSMEPEECLPPEEQPAP